MPRFEPFRGTLYNPDRVPLSDVIAPPYDVIDENHRRELEARSPYNAVRVELAQGEDGADRYQVACRRFRSWLAEGVLATDDEPAFYVYRMGFRDEDGNAHQTSGVIGALELSPPGEGDVLPHERTMPKPRSDRLDLLRACRANLSPIWCLSLAQGLAGLCELPGPPLLRCTDDEGVHHRVWRLLEPGLHEALSSVVASTPAVIADGHHRYETALAYRDERRAQTGSGDHDLVMAYVVELAEGQLAVRAIHRLVTGLADNFDMLGALAPWFDAFDASVPLERLPSLMADAGALALVLQKETWLLRPRSGAFPAGADLDSRRLDTALATLPTHQLSYHHDPSTIGHLVETGQVQAGILLRPASVAQIAATARAGRRMPEKTTFFQPKPRTGLVFRSLRNQQSA